MYADDDFAETTKELVLSRGRRNLLLAEESVGLAENQYLFLLREELPHRQAELEHTLERAQSALQGLEIEQRIERLEHAEALRQARRKLEELERKAAGETAGASSAGGARKDLDA
jgi:hypothetical protein